jgi:hypothetical protein
MQPAPIGTRIQVVGNINNHHYRIGSIQRVHQVDSDGSLKAIDELGIEGDILCWKDCRPVGLGWEWIREHLDAHSLDLLSAFDGLQNLRLRESVETKVITSIPNLAETILRLIPEVEAALEILKTTAQDSDGDDDLVGLDFLNLT